MIVLGLLLETFFWPIWWVMSKSEKVNSTYIFSLKISKTKLAVFSHSLFVIQCSKRQLRHEFYSCLSTILSSFSIFLFMLNHIILSIISSFSCRFCSYSSNLLLIKSIDSLKYFNVLLPLIWLFYSFTHLENFFHLFFQPFHVTIKNYYTVFWFQRFIKNICICRIQNRFV